jgi:cupin fold WbuC family metalloprotein
MITTLSDSDIEGLLARALDSKMLRARICLHKSELDAQQFMLICLLKGSQVGAHRHPVGKSEAYILLNGELQVDFFDDQGALIGQEKLDSISRCLFIPGGTFHEPKSLTNSSMYFEVYPGPFEKTVDVEYLF